MPGGDIEMQRSIYSGYKHQHGLKFQLVVTPDGMLGPLSGPFSCRNHDAKAMTMSHVEEILHDNFRLPDALKVEGKAATHWMLYGDQGNYLEQWSTCSGAASALAQP